MLNTLQDIYFFIFFDRYGLLFRLSYIVSKIKVLTNFFSYLNGIQYNERIQGFSKINDIDYQNIIDMI